jgi:hypothetical protein
MRYLASANESSLTQTSISVAQIERVGWVGGIMYSLMMSFVCIWMIASNPGYYNVDGSD